MSELRVKQINQSELASFVISVGSGAQSGVFNAYINAGGFMGPNVVWASGGPQLVSGDKTFDISPTVPYSGGTGRAISRKYVDDSISTLSGALQTRDLSVSGALDTRLTMTGSLLSVVKVTGSSLISLVNLTGLGGTTVTWSGSFVFISGAAGGGGGGSSTVQVTGSSAIASPNFTGVGAAVLSYDGTYITVAVPPVVPNLMLLTGNQTVNDFKLFTGSPWVANPMAPSGAANLFYVTGVSGALNALLNATTGTTIVTGSNTNNYSFTGITGNFVNMSFWFDQYNLFTGLNTIEAFIGRDFFFTGYAVGTITSGTQGNFSGSFYQRNQTNIKTNFVNFGLLAGQLCTGRGGFNQTVSGMNRVGLDIYTLGTGLTGVSVALFGVGY